MLLIMTSYCKSQNGVLTVIEFEKIENFGILLHSSKATMVRSILKVKENFDKTVLQVRKGLFEVKISISETEMAINYIAISW